MSVAEAFYPLAPSPNAWRYDNPLAAVARQAPQTGKAARPRSHQQRERLRGADTAGAGASNWNTSATETQG